MNNQKNKKNNSEDKVKLCSLEGEPWFNFKEKEKPAGSANFGTSKKEKNKKEETKKEKFKRLYNEALKSGDNF